MLVQVAIDLALDRLFTYEVPEALEKKLAVGQLLSVPFGHREARGFAIEVAAASAAGGLTAQSPERPSRPSCRSSQKPCRLKPIAAIVDETPFFSPNLLTLVKKVAAYTAAPLETVLRTALPAAVLKKNARPRELLFVEPIDQEGTRHETGDVRVSPRQRELYAHIRRLGGGWMAQLCRELKTTPASIRLLAEKGLVTISVRAKRRSPLGNRRILPSKPLPLNAEQLAARDAIFADARPTLLFGVTGSGKTEVYLQAIARELDAGRGAIVMVQIGRAHV